MDKVKQKLKQFGKFLLKSKILKIVIPVVLITFAIFIGYTIFMGIKGEKFDSKDKQKYLPFHADHISDLLYAVLTLLYDREENLKAAANQLYEKYSEEKKHG